MCVNRQSPPQSAKAAAFTVDFTVAAVIAAFPTTTATPTPVALQDDQLVFVVRPHDAVFAAPGGAAPHVPG